jgi:hypothetical protein
MQHNFFYKKIGRISNELITSLQDYVASPDFFTFPYTDFSENVITAGRLSIALKNTIINELSTFFNPEGHIISNIAKMSPMSYVKEHEDVTNQPTYRGGNKHENMIKLQIPFVTNDLVGMMWSPTRDHTSVVNFELGGIYIIDNVRTHSVVNLSTESRYNLTSRFHVDSLLDKSLLD